MAKKFVRNITDTVLRGKNVEPYHTNLQNDLLSDHEDVFVRNGNVYHCITDDIKEIITNKESVKVIETDNKNIALLEFSDEFIKTINDKTLKVKPDSKGFNLEGIEPTINVDGLLELKHKDKSNEFNLSINEEELYKPINDLYTFEYLSLLIHGTGLGNGTYIVQGIVTSPFELRDDFEVFLKFQTQSEEGSGIYFEEIKMETQKYSEDGRTFICSKVIDTKQAENLALSEFYATLILNMKSKTVKSNIKILNELSEKDYATKEEFELLLKEISEVLNEISTAINKNLCSNLIKQGFISLQYYIDNDIEPEDEYERHIVIKPSLIYEDETLLELMGYLNNDFEIIIMLKDGTYKPNKDKKPYRLFTTKCLRYDNSLLQGDPIKVRLDYADDWTLFNCMIQLKTTFGFITVGNETIRM